MWNLGLCGRVPGSRERMTWSLASTRTARWARGRGCKQAATAECPGAVTTEGARGRAPGLEAGVASCVGWGGAESLGGACVIQADAWGGGHRAGGLCRGTGSGDSCGGLGKEVSPGLYFSVYQSDAFKGREVTTFRRALGEKQRPTALIPPPPLRGSAEF